MLQELRQPSGHVPLTDASHVELELGSALANVARVDQLELVEADERPRCVDGGRCGDGWGLAVETPKANEGPNRRIKQPSLAP